MQHAITTGGNEDMPGRNAKFDEAMFEIYRRGKSEAKYNANIFLQMIIDSGGVATAKTLINADKPSDGYTAI